MTLGVRVLVHDRSSNEVLLVKHSYVEGWHLPGGGVETGETALNAMERELHEESGVEISAPPRMYALYYNPRASRRDHVVLYVVDEFTRAIDFKPTEEILAADFFPVTDLPDDISPSSARRIEEVISGAEVSPFW